MPAIKQLFSATILGSFISLPILPPAFALHSSYVPVSRPASSIPHSPVLSSHPSIHAPQARASLLPPTAAANQKPQMKVSSSALANTPTSSVISPKIPIVQKKPSAFKAFFKKIANFFHRKAPSSASFSLDPSLQQAFAQALQLPASLSSSSNGANKITIKFYAGPVNKTYHMNGLGEIGLNSPLITLPDLNIPFPSLPTLLGLNGSGGVALAKK